MIQDSHRKQIAIELVHNSHQLVLPHLQQGERVWNCISGLAIAAMLLNEQEIYKHLFSLILNAPAEFRWQESLFEREGIEKRFPPYQESEVIAMIRACGRSEPHLALSFERSYADAISIAASQAKDSERMLEEIASTQAILGDFEWAQDTIEHHVTSDFRQRGALLVLVIELLRRGRFEQAKSMLHKLDSGNQDVWNRASENVHIVLSLIGRLPWQGYPFPDW